MAENVGAMMPPRNSAAFDLAPTAKGRATAADLAALPEHVTGEIVDGALYAHPRPAVRHQASAARMGRVLGSAFDGAGDGDEPGGWILLPEVELHLGEDVLVPDISGWRRERLCEWPETAFVAVVPDWVCEVLSPKTAGFDRLKKMRRYAAHGVGHVWIVDPIAQSLEVFRLEGATYAVVGGFVGDEKARAEPFDAVEIDLALLWKF